jgi:hypothetical protein
MPTADHETLPEPNGQTCWSHVAVVLAVPWVLLWINPNWPFQALGHMDPWYYFGHFINFPELQRLVPSYAGERLSWVLPGWILSRVFPPPYGAVALSVTAFSASLLAVYAIVRRLADAGSGLLTACLTGCLPAFIGANGWSYIDGGSIAYMLIAYACLVKSARASRPAPYLVFAGMAWAGLIYVYIAWVIFTPACVFFYLAGTRSTHRSRTFRERLTSATRPVAWFGLGWSITTVGLSILHHWLFGWERLFFQHNVMIAFRWVEQMESWSLGRYAWVPAAPWLVLPGLALVVAVGVMTLRTRFPVPLDRAVVAVSLGCVYSILVMVVMTARGSFLLREDYFANILLPSIILLFGVTIWRTPPAIRSIHGIAVLVVACLIASGGLWKPGLVTQLSHDRIAWSWLLGLVVVLVWLARPRRAWSWTVSVIGVAAVTFGLLPTYTVGAWRHAYDGRAAYVRVAQGVQTVGRYVPSRQRHVFWFNNFDQTDPFVAEYRSIMCAFLSHHGSMQRYPDIDRAFAAGTTLVVMGPRRDVFSEANARMMRAGMPLTLVGQEEIRAHTGSYWLTFVRVAPSTSPSALPRAVTGGVQNPTTRPAGRASPGSRAPGHRRRRRARS